MRREDVTPEIVREFLDYDPETGVLTWRARDRKWFKSKVSWGSFNTQFAGKRAFTSVSKNRYFQGLILGFTFSAHQVAFAHYHGEWPEHGIDHDNGDGFDNRIANLFDRTQAENCKNKSLRTDSASGHLGVRQNDAGTWVVTIGCAYVGSFKEFGDAIDARQRAEQEHGYHPNHGRLA